jgi:hypothetical protein
LPIEDTMPMPVTTTRLMGLTSFRVSATQMAKVRH